MVFFCSACRNTHTRLQPLQIAPPPPTPSSPSQRRTSMTGDSRLHLLGHVGGGGAVAMVMSETERYTSEQLLPWRHTKHVSTAKAMWAGGMGGQMMQQAACGESAK